MSLHHFPNKFRKLGLRPYDGATSIRFSSADNHSNLNLFRPLPSWLCLFFNDFSDLRGCATCAQLSSALALWLVINAFEHSCKYSTVVSACQSFPSNYLLSLTYYTAQRTKSVRILFFTFPLRARLYLIELIKL